MEPAQALAWRFSLAAAALWFMLVRRGGHRRPPREYRNALLLGVLGFAPQAGLYFLAVRYLDPGLASLLLYLYPAFVVGISFAFLGRRPRRAQIAALVLSIAGCVLTLWTRGAYPLVGYAFGLAVAVTYAAYLVIGERATAGIDPIFIAANLMASSAVVYWIVVAATGSFLVPASFPAVAGIVGLAALGSIVPIVTLFAAMRVIGASDVALVSTIEPLFTVGLSALFFGERLTGLQLVGGALIVAGVLVLNLKKKESRS